MQPKYVRVDHTIYALDTAGARTVFLNGSSIGEAKRWVRAQEKREPGSVRAETPERKPVVTTASAKNYRDFVRAEARETGQRNQQLRRSKVDLSQPTRMGPYVTPDTTSSLRTPSRRPECTPSRRNSAR